MSGNTIQPPRNAYNPNQHPAPRSYLPSHCGCMGHSSCSHRVARKCQVMHAPITQKTEQLRVQMNTVRKQMAKENPAEILHAKQELVKKPPEHAPLCSCYGCKQCVGKLERDFAYIDAQLHELADDVEAAITYIAKKMAARIHQDIEEIKTALKFVLHNLKLDLVEFLRDVNILERHLQRICEILLAILIQIHAVNLPPVAEVQGGIAAAIIALGALDLLLEGDQRLNEKLVNKLLGQANAKANLGPLSKAVVDARDYLVPGFVNFVRIGQAMGMVPIEVNPYAIKMALQDACDGGLKRIDALNKKVDSVEEAIEAKVKSTVDAALQPFVYAASFIPKPLTPWYWLSPAPKPEIAAAPAPAAAAAAAAPTAPAARPRAS